MSVGPSPVIPFLIVGALGLFAYGPDLIKASELLSEVQETTVALQPLLFIPLLVFLVVGNFMAELIVIPILLLLLMVFLLNNILIAPLILLLVIQFYSKYYTMPSGRMTYEKPQGLDGEGDDTGIGLGCFVFMLLFVILYALFYDGEGYAWVSLLIVLVSVMFCNMLR